MYISYMEKIDLKTATVEVRDTFRVLVKRHKKSGKSNGEIAELLGIPKITVKRYAASSQTKEKTRGRKPKEQQALSESIQTQIVKWISDDTPDQYKLPFALWNRRSVTELIQEKFGIKLAVRTIGNYLNSWGFTPQKALIRAYEQSPEAVKKWLDEDYPVIEQEAKADNAEIYWADETGVRNDDQRARGYSPRGKTPELKLNGKRFRVNMISAVNNQGKSSFMVYTENMAVGLLIKFLVKLHREVGRKVVVILDNLRVHHAKILQNWLKKEKIKERIAIKHLPSYSPELNPDEYFNGDLKGEINRRPPARSQSEIVAKTIESAGTILQDRKRVSGYFRHPKIAYAG